MVSSIPFKPISELTEIEALLLINRWLKVPNYFYYADRDALYELKDDVLQRWLADGQIEVPKVIRRDTKVIAAMKAQIVKNGEDLDWLNFVTNESRAELEADENFHYYSLLESLLEGCYECDLSDSQRQSLLESHEQKMSIYEQQFEVYRQAQAVYDQAFQKQTTAQAAYQKSLKDAIAAFILKLKPIYPSTEKLVKKHCRALSGDRSRIRDSQWNAMLEIANCYRFVAPSQPSLKPLPEKPKPPQKPCSPFIDGEVSLGVENYLPGLIPEVEDAIDWVRENLSFSCDWSKLSDLDVGDLEKAFGDYVLAPMKQWALDVFQDIIDHRSGAEAAWNSLSTLYLDYSCVGINSFTPRGSYQSEHREFSRFHEIELSSTGYWLVELRLVNFPDVIFHCPYNQYLEWDTPLPEEFEEISSEQKFGRSLTNAEQAAYPIGELVQRFGLSQSNFPCSLCQYSRPGRYYDWDDEDWLDDD